MEQLVSGFCNCSPPSRTHAAQCVPSLFCSPKILVFSPILPRTSKIVSLCSRHSPDENNKIDFECLDIFQRCIHYSSLLFKRFYLENKINCCSFVVEQVFPSTKNIWQRISSLFLRNWSKTFISMLI